MVLHGGSTMATQWGRRAMEGERVLHGGWAPFVAGRGGGRRAARRETVAGETAAGNRGRGSRQWP
jgi:hypothetical protein